MTNNQLWCPQTCSWISFEPQEIHGWSLVNSGPWKTKKSFHRKWRQKHIRVPFPLCRVPWMNDNICEDLNMYALEVRHTTLFWPQIFTVNMILSQKLHYSCCPTFLYLCKSEEFVNYEEEWIKKITSSESSCRFLK